MAHYGVRTSPRGSAACAGIRLGTLEPLGATDAVTATALISDPLPQKLPSSKTLLPPLTCKMAQSNPPKPALPDHVLRAIRGEQTEEEKQAQLDKSLSSWWKEYAARKNDEDQEHVADSLLYDERCHLPRTAPPPTLSNGTKLGAAGTKQ